MNYLAKLYHLLSNDLKKIDELILNLVKKQKVNIINDITEHLMNAGGKRLRPLLTIAWAQMITNNHEDANNNHILLAAAVEFIHTATLLHDDVIDKSIQRRGKSTANSIWGNKSSILVGDYLFSQSFKLMVKAGSKAALKSLAQASSIIAEAELWQLELINDLSIQVEDYLRLVIGKTATLFSAACEAGAIISTERLKANISKSDREKICDLARSFGLNLGISFQIIDDLLDYYGFDEDLGKNIGKDFQEKKVTLPLILAYKKAEISDKKAIEELLNSEIERENLSKIQQIFTTYNIKDLVIEYAKEYVEKAVKNLQDLPIIYNKEICNLLSEIALNSITRQK